VPKVQKWRKKKRKKNDLWTKHQKNIPKVTWISLKIDNNFMWFTLLFRISWRKEEVKEEEPNGNPKILMPSKRV
jgi:hypothetical protein